MIFILGPKDRSAQIIGVVEDYHQQSLRLDYEPILFFYPDYYNAMYMTINMRMDHVQETINTVASAYSRFFPDDPFNYFFLDDYFHRQYQADLKFGKICLLFSILAIAIAALGLFGLGSYMAQQ